MTIEFEYGTFGVCMGTPTIGVPCNDYVDCTIDDECKMVETDDGQQIAQCMGVFAQDMPCVDYDDECTINDRCGPGALV